MDKNGLSKYFEEYKREINRAMALHLVSGGNGQNFSEAFSFFQAHANQLELGGTYRIKLKILLSIFEIKKAINQQIFFLVNDITEEKLNSMRKELVDALSRRDKKMIVYLSEKAEKIKNEQLQIEKDLHVELYKRLKNFYETEKIDQHDLSDVRERQQLKSLIDELSQDLADYIDDEDDNNSENS